MIRFLQQDSRITKFIFWAIIVVVAAFMVITLVPGIFSDGPSDGSGTYAIVKNGGYFGRVLTVNEPITTQQVQRLASRMLQQQKLPDMLMPYVMKRAADSLVQEQMLSYEADRLGLKVTDQDLRTELQKGAFGEYLFPSGQFIGEDRYANFVSMQFNMSVAEFESTLKRELSIARLQQFVTSGVTVSDGDVRNSYLQQGTKVKFDYAFLSDDQIKQQINPTDAQLEAFFKSHAKQYANAVGETRKLQYVALDPSQTPGGAPKVTDADLQAYYQKHIDQFQVKDQVRVRHILIKVPQGADAATDAAAKKKAEDIRKQIVAGGDFAKLAKENSDDPGSKEQGGELGFITKGQTVPEFEQAAFALNPGQTSNVVKTQFGYHILQTEEQTAHTTPLSAVKGQIEPIVQHELELTASQKYAQQIADQAKSQGIEKTAAAHHLEAQTTEYLARNSTVGGVPDGAAMLTGAFAAKAGSAPQVASTGEGFAVYTVVDVKPAHAPAFAEYKTHILDDYRAEQAPALLRAKTQELIARAKADNDLEKAAKELGATYKSSDLVGDDAQVPDIGSIAANASQIFALNQGQIGGPFDGGRVSYAVKLDEKQQPSAADVAAHFDATKDKLLNDKRERLFAVFVSTLQERYKNEKRILYTKQDAQLPLGQS
jgi:peptidyl-prolyl cis-trans isomerase D